MTDKHIPPNELADLYEAFFTVLENLPEETHPAWEFAIESMLFGGDGLAPTATSYGEQQAERNTFKISEYRTVYGNGNRVTDFPTLTVRRPAEQDKQFLNDVLLPVLPKSDQVIPLFVDDDTFGDAISLLNEFPAEPDAEASKTGSSEFLNPSRFPGISSSSTPDDTASPKASEQGATTHEAELAPNELADIYDTLSLLLEHIPRHAHPKWRQAIETVLFGGEYLMPDASTYGEQQSERNDFKITEYRSKYGDGNQVTEFPTLSIRQPTGDDRPLIEEDVRLPVAPETETVLPLAPDADELEEAISLLDKFPAEPRADSPGRGIPTLLDKDALIGDIRDELISPSIESQSDAESHSSQESSRSSSQSEPASETHESADSDAQEDRTVLRSEQPGESASSLVEKDTIAEDSAPKYEDPRAEEAHRKAQQRNPSEVVELGEEIKLVLTEVDYSYHPPTIMGAKNKLVIFVMDAPQDLSKYDTIRAKVIDYGGKNNSAEAVFTGYAD